MLNVYEIVSSVQGEGQYSGYPTTFIRLCGCNLECSFCDTKHAISHRRKKRMSVDTVCTYVFKMGNQHVCVTGGEPLLQDECLPLVYELVGRGYKVSIETNGSIYIEDGYLRSFSYVMDIKCPSSGMDHFNIYENLYNLQPIDEVKFVISDIEDYVFAKDVIEHYPTKAKIIFSPVIDSYGTHNGKEIAEWIIEDKIPKVRLGIQLHKIIDVY